MYLCACIMLNRVQVFARGWLTGSRLSLRTFSLHTPIWTESHLCSPGIFINFIYITCAVPATRLRHEFREHKRKFLSTAAQRQWTVAVNACFRHLLQSQYLGTGKWQKWAFCNLHRCGCVPGTTRVRLYFTFGSGCTPPTQLTAY